MKKICALLLCLSLLITAAPLVSAAPGTYVPEINVNYSPFGSEVEPLTAEELAEVEGEYKQVLLAAAAGSIVSATEYLITTPVSEWSWSGVGRSIVAGAATGALTSLIPW